MEALTLPEPGRELFVRTRKLLVRGAGLAEKTDRPRAVFAGGTILAARWHHRTSKDIDIRCAHHAEDGVLTRLRRLPVMLTRWNQWLGEAGMAPLEWKTAHKARSQIRGREGENEPTLEIGQFAAPLETSVARAHVDGADIWVASTEAILAGKWWGRRHNPPVRDVFDWAVAATMAPHAVQMALETVKASDAIDRFVDTMAARRNDYVADSRNTKRSLQTTGQWDKERRNPAYWAAATISRWAMTDLTVERAGEGWTVTTRCEAQPEGTLWTKSPAALEHAVALAQRIAQWSDETAAAVCAQCRRDGGCTTNGAGKRRERTVTRAIAVDAHGKTRMSELGTIVAVEPTVARAVERGIEEGMWGRDEAREVQRELEQARTDAKTPTRA